MNVSKTIPIPCPRSLQILEGYTSSNGPMLVQWVRQSLVLNAAGVTEVVATNCVKGSASSTQHVIVELMSGDIVFVGILGMGVLIGSKSTFTGHRLWCTCE